MGVFLKSTTQTGTFDPNGVFPGTDELRRALAWYQQDGIVKDSVNGDKLVNQQYSQEGCPAAAPAAG